MGDLERKGILSVFMKKILERMGDLERKGIIFLRDNSENTIQGLWDRGLRPPGREAPLI